VVVLGKKGIARPVRTRSEFGNEGKWGGTISKQKDEKRDDIKRVNRSCFKSGHIRKTEKRGAPNKKIGVRRGKEEGQAQQTENNRRERK